MGDFWVESRIDLDSLASQMGDELSKEDLLKFIEALDERVAEWDFTVMVRDHFNGIEYPKEAN